MILQDSISVAANAVSANVLAGSLGEFLRQGGPVVLYTNGSALGLRCSFLVGEQVFIDDMALNAQNRMPVVPDDFLGAAQGQGGDRVVVRFRNTTAGALTAFWRIETP